MYSPTDQPRPQRVPPFDCGNPTDGLRALPTFGETHPQRVPLGVQNGASLPLCAPGSSTGTRSSVCFASIRESWQQWDLEKRPQPATLPTEGDRLDRLLGAGRRHRGAARPLLPPPRLAPPGKHLLAHGPNPPWSRHLLQRAGEARPQRLLEGHRCRGGLVRSALLE